MIDLRPDQGAEIRRVMRLLDDLAPLAPDLAGLRPARRRRRPTRRGVVVVIAAAFLLTVGVLAPVALLHGASNDREDSGGASDAADNTSTSSAAALGGSLDLDATTEVALPPVEVESFLVAATDEAVFVSATVPDPERWDVRVWRSLDRGDTWQEVLSLEDEGLDTDLVASGTDVTVLLSNHVGTGGATVFRSTDSGETWDRMVLPLPANAAGVWATSLVDAGDRTLVLGTTWESIATDDLGNGNSQTSHVGQQGVSWLVGDAGVDGPHASSELGYANAAVGFDGGFVAVGHPHEDDRTPGAWRSSDGIAWETIPLSPPPAEWVYGGELDTVVVGGDVLAIVGELRRGSIDSDTMATAVFASDDGEGWSMHPIDTRVLGPVVGSSAGFVARADAPTATLAPALAISSDAATWEFDDIGVSVHGGVATSDTVYLTGRDVESSGQVLVRIPID